MKTAFRTASSLVAGLALLGAGARAQDWPQWRGANRDGKATGFTAPKTWPKELKEQWKVTVGDGVATPALVGDKLYVFTREGGDEVVRCLNAADRKEVWKEKYESAGFRGADGGFVGPRSSPAVADGKVVTLGAIGILTCFDAASGKRLWQKNDFKGSLPRFHVSSSPIIVDGLCVVQLGAGRSGGIVAYDLTSGDEKWKWVGDGAGYASPVVVSVGGSKVIVAETEGNVVAVGAADGKLLWKTPFPTQRMEYNACTPMVDGQTIIYSGAGRGTKVIKLEKKGDELTTKELWSLERGVQFNTPVLKDGLIFGIFANDKLFCLSAETGKTAWETDFRGGGRPGYGSVVDAGTVLMALNPSGQLLVFEPSGKEYKELAKYKVAKGDTYAYPVVSGNRIFIKDRDSVTLYTVE
jgi:outer membrane protein assembly factor BamB